VQPAQESLDAVNEFLQSNGISATKLSPAGDWLGFDLPISKANELFAADFSVYKHIDSGEESIRTLSYSLPSSLDKHIDVVLPMNK
jgi:tripeptidyl-peptidase-1